MGKLEAFPSLCRLSLLENSSISEFLEASSMTLGDANDWNLHLSHNLNDGDLPQLVGLLVRLDSVRIFTTEDRRVWIHDPSGCFSCKSMFYCLA